MASPVSANTPNAAILKLQNNYLAFGVMKNLLGDRASRFLQQEQPPRYEATSTNAGVKEASATIEKACLALRESKGDEMDALVSTLSTGDSQLWTSYHQVCDRLMAENINFGRIITLFFFTYTLSNQLLQNGSTEKMKSVVCWLEQYLNDKITPWLLEEHGGNWVI